MARQVKIDRKRLMAERKAAMAGPPKLRLPPGAIVVLGFAALAAFAFAIKFLAGAQPTTQDSCVSYCAANGRAGQLQYRYPVEQTGPNRRGPPECKCS